MPGWLAGPNKHIAGVADALVSSTSYDALFATLMSTESEENRCLHGDYIYHRAGAGFPARFRLSNFFANVSKYINLFLDGSFILAYRTVLATGLADDSLLKAWFSKSSSIMPSGCLDSSIAKLLRELRCVVGNCYWCDAISDTIWCSQLL